MFDVQEIGARLAETWPWWVVTITLVGAAVVMAGRALNLLWPRLRAALV